MKVLSYIILGTLCAAVGYVIGKSKCRPLEVSGIGAGGKGRYGIPKTEEERLATHQAIYGSQELPPRGTGIKRRGLG